MKKITNRTAFAAAIVAALMMAVGCDKAVEAEIPADGTAALANLNITTRAGETNLTGYTFGYIYLTMKDANGEEKIAEYVYNAADDEWTTPNAITVGNGDYPAHAYGNLTMEYDGQDTPVPIAWLGPLTTSGAETGTATADMQMGIATARFKTTIVGAFDEEADALPTFIVSTPAKRWQESGSFDQMWNIPADPYTDIHTAKASDDPVPDWDAVSGTGTSSPHVAPGQTFAAGEELFTITAFTNDARYAGMTYTVLAPAGGVTIEAGNEYQYTIALGGSGEAKIVAASIAPFTDGGETVIKGYKGITTEAELRAFADDWNTNATDPAASADVIARWSDTGTSTGIIRLLADIEMDANNGNFTPIGTSNINPFTGVFDGGGHTITGLRVETATSAGLFRMIFGGTVRGVHVREAAIKATSNSAGGIAGYLHSGTIAACSFEGSVEAPSNVGGIAGLNSGTILGCYSLAASVTAGTPVVGGIAGYNKGTITACHWLASASPGAVPTVATTNFDEGTSTACFMVSSTDELGANTLYVRAMNNALAAAFAGDDPAKNVYRWLTIPGSAPMLMPVAAQRVSGIANESDLRGFSAAWNINDNGVAAGLIYGEPNDASLFRLMDNIVMTESGGLFTPIGTSANHFSGTFDGGGHTITGLHVETAGGAGLFGYINEGTVRAVNVRDAIVKATGTIAGGIAGYFYTGTIAACSFSGTVEAVSGYAGGIAGYNNFGTLIGCFSIASSVKAADYFGGIAGANNATITGCHWLKLDGITNAAGNGPAATYCYPFATRGDLHANSMYVRSMNNALATLSGDRNLYSWAMPATSGALPTLVAGAATRVTGIATEADLRGLSAAYALNRDFAAFAYADNGVYQLMNDIDMSDDPFTPIGTDTNQFTGTFDGGGHTITGLRVAVTDFAGLFGYIGNGTVRGVNVRDAVIKATGDFAGGIAGFIGSGTVAACSFEGSVEASVSGAGGIAGSNNGGIIVGCFSIASSVTGGSFVGGIASNTGYPINGCHWLTDADQPNVATASGSAANSYPFTDRDNFYANPLNLPKLMNTALTSYTDWRWEGSDTDYPKLVKQ